MTTFFKSHTLTVTRRALPTISKGFETAGGTTTFTIQTSWQPATGDELKALALEGYGGVAIYKGYTDSEVRTAGKNKEHLADEISWDSKTFRIVSVAVYENGILPHYRFMAVQI